MPKGLLESHMKEEFGCASNAFLLPFKKQYTHRVVKIHDWLNMHADY